MVVRKRLLATYVVLRLLTAGIATCSQLGVAQTSGAGMQASICSTNGTASAKLNEYMTALTDAGQFSGVVLVAQNGTVLLSKGYGMANYECCVPNTPQTVFPIGSNTKQFTAAAIMKLQEQGRLNVTDPITKYIPDAPPQWKDIKIYELMNHTSGMPREGYNVTDPVNMALSDLVHQFYSAPLLFQPGTNVSYSNNGYVTLSYIIEQVSGQSYDQYLRQNIFQPLGMTSTGQENASDVVPNRATGYTTEGGKLIHYDLQNVHNSYGAGSLHSTIDDLYRWEQAFHTQGAILSSASLDAMFANDYGINQATYLNRAVLRHAGRNFGFISQTLNFADDNVTILFLSNYDRIPVSTVTKDLVAIVFGEPYSLPQRIDRQETPLNATALQAYTGTYELVSEHWNYTVFQDGNQLYYTSSVPYETVKLFHESNDTFFVTNESSDSFIFTRDANGTVSGFNMTTGTGTDTTIKVS
ncbi:MAG: serine hydrolase [Halobacteriota archaeon]